MIFIFIFLFSSLPYFSEQTNSILRDFVRIEDGPWSNIFNHILTFQTSTSRAGINNLDFFANIHTRIIQFYNFSQVNLDWNICNFRTRNIFSPIVFFLGIVSISYVTIRKRKSSKEAFILVLFFSIFLELCFTTSTLIQFHFLLTFPLPFIIMAYGLNKSMKVWTLGTLIFLFLLISLNLLMKIVL